MQLVLSKIFFEAGQQDAGILRKLFGCGLSAAEAGHDSRTFFRHGYGKLGPHNLRRAHIDARQRDYIGGQKRAQHASRRSRNCPSVVR